MPDLEISKLPPLTGAGLAATDPLAIADLSASETKKVTAKDLVQSSMALIDDDSIPGGKIENGSITAEEIGDNAVGSSELADGSVDNAALQDDSISQEKLKADSVGTAQLINESVTGPKLGDVTNRGLDQVGDLIGHTNNITAGTFAGIDYDGNGHVVTVPADGLVPPGSLPAATDSEIGAIKPGTGLVTQGDGTLDHSNSITAGDIGGLKFDSEGHISAIPLNAVFERDAIPIAGNTADDLGGVFVPVDSAAVGIAVDGVTGELGHESSQVAAGVYAGVTVDDNGHVTAGNAQLTEGQLPDGLPADQITVNNGQLPTLPNTPDVGIASQGYTEAISNGSISRRHLGNSSTAYIQETVPPANTSPTDQTPFRGCLWLRESTGQLWMYNGNAWRIIAGGRLSQENLRFCGTIDASTGNVVALTDEGVSEQLESGAPAFAVGSPLPNCEDGISGTYFMVETAGNAINVEQVVGVDFRPGDLVLALGQVNGWTNVSGAGGGGGGGGSGLWERTGAAPDAQLQPINKADNLVLTLSEWLALPRNTSTAAPLGGEGSLRWHEVDNELEVFDGVAWQRVTFNSELPWETITAADNDGWGQDVLRPVTAVDVTTPLDRDLVFSRGTAGTATSTGDHTSNLTTAALTASRTWELPDVSGTIVTNESALTPTDNLVIDCGEYG